MEFNIAELRTTLAYLNGYVLSDKRSRFSVLVAGLTIRAMSVLAIEKHLIQEIAELKNPTIASRKIENENTIVASLIQAIIDLASELNETSDAEPLLGKVAQFILQSQLMGYLLDALCSSESLAEYHTELKSHYPPEVLSSEHKGKGFSTATETNVRKSLKVRFAKCLPVITASRTMEAYLSVMTKDGRHLYSQRREAAIHVSTKEAGFAATDPLTLLPYALMARHSLIEYTWRKLSSFASLAIDRRTNIVSFEGSLEAYVARTIKPQLLMGLQGLAHRTNQEIERLSLEAAPDSSDFQRECLQLIAAVNYQRLGEVIGNHLEATQDLLLATWLAVKEKKYEELEATALWLCISYPEIFDLRSIKNEFADTTGLGTLAVLCPAPIAACCSLIPIEKLAERIIKKFNHNHDIIVAWDCYIDELEKLIELEATRLLGKKRSIILNRANQIREKLKNDERLLKLISESAQRERQKTKMQEEIANRNKRLALESGAFVSNHIGRTFRITSNDNNARVISIQGSTVKILKYDEERGTVSILYRNSELSKKAQTKASNILSDVESGRWLLVGLEV